MSEESSVFASGLFDFTPQTMEITILYSGPSNIHTHTYFCSFQSLDLALKYCNYFFTSTFVLEAVLKLIAFGFRRFFKDRYTVSLFLVCWQCASVSVFPFLSVLNSVG